MVHVLSVSVRDHTKFHQYDFPIDVAPPGGPASLVVLGCQFLPGLVGDRFGSTSFEMLDQVAGRSLASVEVPRQTRY